MPKSTTTKSLYATYLSTMCILCVLLVLAQGIIQFALAQAIRTQNAYNVLNTQQLRTQRLIRNSLLLLDSHADRPTLLLALYSDEQAWEITQDGIDYGNAGLSISPGDFPSTVHNRLNNARPDYLKMRTALHDLIESATAGATNKIIIAYVAPIFYSGGVYTAALTSASADLFTESNVYVANIRFIEFGLFLLCLLTLATEYLFVFQPAFRRMKAYLTQLQATISQQEHRIHEDDMRPTPHSSGGLPVPPEEETDPQQEQGTLSETQKGLFDDEKHRS